MTAAAVGLEIVKGEDDPRFRRVVVIVEVVSNNIVLRIPFKLWFVYNWIWYTMIIVRRVFTGWQCGTFQSFMATISYFLRSAFLPSASPDIGLERRPT